MARPFLKWAGGKGQLVDEILKHVPASFTDYHEPFLGGGAVFFRLLSSGSFSNGRPFLSDSNQELIRTYRTVRDEVEHLIEQLRSYETMNDREHYLDVRAQHWETEVDLASRFIYLNRTCFNGLYRVNKSGRFNVPFGNYKNPRICDAENLQACSTALRNSNLEWYDFADMLSIVRSGSLVYLDPPYPAASKTGDFTSYTKEGFGWNDHVRLRDTILRLREKGAHVILSNADQPRVLELYEGHGFVIHHVESRRNVSAKSSGRGKTTELLILA